jgi:hypothetical protein
VDWIVSGTRRPTAVVAERHAMLSRRSTTRHTNYVPDHDRELVRALRDALVLAAGERAARQALRHARTKAHRGWPRRLAASGHLAGYASLLAVIGYQWRARQRSAA